MANIEKMLEEIEKMTVIDKAGVAKDEAEEIKKQLEAAGATVTLK